jgi:hypothetical protein
LVSLRGVALGIREPARRWEYKAKWIPRGRQKGPFGGAIMELAFNKLGAQGWELVAIEGERAMFKREILDLSDAEREELAAVEDDEDESEEA